MARNSSAAKTRTKSPGSKAPARPAALATKKVAKTGVGSRVSGRGSGVRSTTVASQTPKPGIQARKPKAQNPKPETQRTPVSGYKGISRIDNPARNSYGWYVRVRFKGENHSKFFSDSVHGGRDSALRKAVRHRNRLEREIGKPRTDRTLIVRPSRNESGMVGVKRTLKANSPVYEVTWCPAPKVIHRTSVSINKYGEEEAFRRACAIRLEKEKKLYGAVLQDQPAAPPPVRRKRRK